MQIAVDTNFIMGVIGWTGALAVLLPYFLLSLNHLPATSPWYQGLNAFGSLLLIVNTAYNRSFPSTTVNVIWVGIAVYAFIKQRRRDRSVRVVNDGNSVAR